MTDKQIIINSVDVSGCECIIEDYQRANNFKGKYEHIKNVCELGERGAEYYNLFCKDNPNCYYKQLKHKEQEIEILKTQNIALQTMEFEEKKKYKKALKRIEHLVTHAFCLTIGTNKDTANLAQQIMRIVAKAKDGE